MKNPVHLTSLTLMLAASNLPATTHYVSLESTNPTPPYTSWGTAATNIQQAVNAAAAGDEVVVTNGVYPGQVLVSAPLGLRSVNGPQFTVIDGGGILVRCISLPDGGSLTGFTLTNGYPLWGDYNGGGVWCASTNAFITNCLIVGNSVTPDASGNGGRGGGVYGGTLYNCTLSGNHAVTHDISVPYPPYRRPAFGHGAGAYGSVLYNCTLTGNLAPYAYAGGAEGGYLYNCTVATNSGGWGGGVYSATLHNCTLSGNSASGGYGGGAVFSTLYNCALTGNSVDTAGGGAYNSTLYNCTLTANSATNRGGGAYNGTLYNCWVTANSAGPNGYGGGVAAATLFNCTLFGNSASRDTYGNGGWGGGEYQSVAYNCTLSGNSAYAGGGAYQGDYQRGLYNCIVYFNSAANGANCDYNAYTNLNFCCTTPQPTNGVGNISAAPSFVDYAGGNLRLQSNSPCIDAGNNAYVTTATDLDGNPRIVNGTVDMGAYEFQLTIPRITGSKFLSSSNFWLQSSGLPNQFYSLQISTNLLNWSDLTNLTAGPNGVCEFVDGGAAQCGTRFYRLKVINP